MIWVTSDQHFDHSNIIKYCDRPFEDVREMNLTLINNFNSVVKEDDITYHLGDFCFKREPLQYLKRLNGKHCLIKGNHDHHNKVNGFEWVKDVHLLRTPIGMFWLSHYAHRTWPHFYHGCIHLFGHSHGNIENTHNSMDVGVDSNNFFPHKLTDIYEKLKEKS